MTGWDWFDPDTAAKEDDAGTHWQTCFASDAGQQVLRDLETQFIRHPGPRMPDRPPFGCAKGSVDWCCK